MDCSLPGSSVHGISQAGVLDHMIYLLNKKCDEIISMAIRSVKNLNTTFTYFLK